MFRSIQELYFAPDHEIQDAPKIIFQNHQNQIHDETGRSALESTAEKGYRKTTQMSDSEDQVGGEDHGHDDDQSIEDDGMDELFGDDGNSGKDDDNGG